MKKLIYLLRVLAMYVLAFPVVGQTAPETQGRCVGPDYPSASVRLEEQGVVTIRFSVGTDGKVLSSEVEKSSGFKRLDEAARSSLVKCQFKPVLKDGIPVEVVSNKNYTFRLETGKIETPLPYKVSAANVEVLRNGNFPKMRFFSFSEPEYLSINCMLADNPLYVSLTNIPINKFIENAFNSELQEAGLYSEQGMLLTADIRRISASFFPIGSWDLEMDLKLEIGKKIKYFYTHNFPLPTNYGPLNCLKAAEEFPIAIQKLFYKIAASKALADQAQ